ncbi:MAG: hypothetical protein KDB18_14295, partial [Salinibacterium sp.]|nr:hypothetical protein [Salinibacterium sp.]
AWHAARAMLELVKTTDDGVAVPELEDYDIRWVRGEGDSWGRQFHLRADMTQPLPVVAPRDGFRHREVSHLVVGTKDLVTTRPEAIGPRVLLFHDSFGELPRRFMADYLPTLISVWNLHFDDRLIESLRPDVVIQLVVERNLDAGVFRGGGRLTKSGPAGSLDENRRRALVGRWTNPVLGHFDLSVTEDGSLSVTSDLGRWTLERQSTGVWQGGPGAPEGVRFIHERARGDNPAMMRVSEARAPLPTVWVRPPETKDPVLGPRTGRYDRGGELFYLQETESGLASFSADGQFLGLLSPIGDSTLVYDVRGRFETPVVFDGDDLFLEVGGGRIRAKRLR